MAALNAIRATVLTGFQASDTITQGPFTFTFNQPVTAQETEDGLHLVVAPPGTTITGYTPAPTTIGGSFVGGCMKNPQARAGSSHRQAFDARAFGFDATLLPAFPLPVTNGDVFLAATPAESFTFKDWQRCGVVANYGALFFVSSFPSGTGVFAPCVGGWTGRSALATHQVDLDAYVATLPALSLSGVSYPAVSAVIARLDRYYGAGYMTNGTTGGYEHMMPRGCATADTVFNYGQYVAQVIGAAGLHLVGDVATPAQKRAIVRRFVQMAINWYDAGMGSGVRPYCDGAHHQFQIVPIAVGLHAMGRTAALDALHTDFAGLHQFGQLFTLTAADMAGLSMHTSNDLPYFSRRREVRWVDPDDSRRFAVKQAAAQIDPTQMTFNGSNIVRDGGGSALAVQTVPFATLAQMTAFGIPANRTDLLSASNGGSGQGGVFIRIETPLSPPLAEGQFIHGTPLPGHTMVVGDVLWKIRPEFSTFSPLPYAPYATINDFADDLLVLRAIPGIWRTAWEPLRSIIVRAQPQDWPNPTTPYSDMHTNISLGGTFAFSKTFWTAHAATLGLT